MRGVYSRSRSPSGTMRDLGTTRRPLPEVRVRVRDMGLTGLKYNLEPDYAEL